MEWWDKMMNPVRKVCQGVGVRLGIRKRGILSLRHDVRACEYEDVRIMWEMLKRETENGKSKKRSLWNRFSWARRSPYFGRNRGLFRSISSNAIH